MFESTLHINSQEKPLHSGSEKQSEVHIEQNTLQAKVLQSYRMTRMNNLQGDVDQALSTIPVLQRVQTSGQYVITGGNATLRERDAPYNEIKTLNAGDPVTISKGADERRFRRRILSYNHTWVTDVANDQGWIKDNRLRLVAQNMQDVSDEHFDDKIAESRIIGQESDSRAVKRREAHKMQVFGQQKVRVKAWIPLHLDTTNLYAFVSALNHNMLAQVQYQRNYNTPERVIANLRGDCRSISETNKFIAETVLGAQGIRIESVGGGVRVAGSAAAADMYTNHHWLNINGRRLDAMEDEDFSFDSWEIYRNEAWRALTADDIVQGISENRPFLED